MNLFQVQSCSDCPFAHWGSGNCTLINAARGGTEEPTELDDETLPSECPLRGNPVRVVELVDGAAD